MIAKIVACFSGLSAAESGWLLGRVIFHAADVNNFGVSSTRLSSLKGKGNFIIICSGTAPQRMTFVRTMVAAHSQGETNKQQNGVAGRRHK